MLYLGELFGLAMLVLWIYSLVDVITTDEASCRNLPKLGWLLIVVIVPFGWVAWLVAGRPVRSSPRGKAMYERPRSDYPEYDRPGRMAAVDPNADENFLRQCRARAEQQRRKARGEDPGGPNPGPDPNTY